jgi:hypothetical protein
MNVSVEARSGVAQFSVERAENNGIEGLLVRAKPIEVAERLCRRLSGEVWVADDVLFLVTDLEWAGAINTVLVKKGLRVSELHHVGRGQNRS